VLGSGTPYRGPRAGGEPRTTGPGRLRLISERPNREPRERVPLDDPAGSSRARVETSTRVLIAAGEALVRASYRALLDSDELIEVVATAASGEQALALVTDSRPDVALLDLAAAGLDQLETIVAIVTHPAFADVAVMLIAASEHDERVAGALQAGAAGLLSKDTEPAELIRAVQLLARGHAVFPAEVVRHLLAELPPQSGREKQLPGRLNELTDREREVVALVAKGLSNAEIAAQLVISPATAKTHVSRAMVKLRARDRAQLVVLAYETGLVLAEPSSPAPATGGMQPFQPASSAHSPEGTGAPRSARLNR
jgi:DNA-binding NarL/FixJ family response regulator